jgi:predicted nucleic acid-binding protein
MILVDTSVWSLALRRDAGAGEPEVLALEDALLGNEVVVTTGLVLQGLLQGFSMPKAQAQIVQRFAALPLIQPDRNDHVAAAGVRNTCRRGGVRIGTIDALLAQLCIRHELTLLTTDKDFVQAARHCPLSIRPAKALRRGGDPAG